MQNCKEFHKDRKEITGMVENYLFLAVLRKFFRRPAYRQAGFRR